MVFGVLCVWCVMRVCFVAAVLDRVSPARGQWIRRRRLAARRPRRPRPLARRRRSPERPGGGRSSCDESRATSPSRSDWRVLWRFAMPTRGGSFGPSPPGSGPGGVSAASPVAISGARPPPWAAPVPSCSPVLYPSFFSPPLPSPSGLLLWPSPPPPPGWAVLSGPSSAPAARLPSALARGAPSQRACASASCRSGVCPRWGSRLAPVGLRATASRPSAMAPGGSSRRSRARAQIMFLQGPGVRGR